MNIRNAFNLFWIDKAKKKKKKIENLKYHEMSFYKLLVVQ